MSPFELDERAERSKRHPVWRYWAAVIESVEPPKAVVIVGM